MSTGALRGNLSVLRSQDWTVLHKRVRALDGSFQLIESLVNPKNVALVVNELLLSDLWRNSEAYDVAYAVFDAARFLSADAASLRRPQIIKSVQRSSAAHWKKAVLLAACLSAQLRGVKEVPAWPAFRNHYGSSFVAAANAACLNQVVDHSVGAALLVAMSYCWPNLSASQQNSLHSSLLISLAQSLYLSNLIFSTATEPLKATSRFAELGILSRTLASAIETSPRTNYLIISETLLNVAQRSGVDRTPQSTAKPVFLSVLLIQQSILVAAVRSNLTSEKLSSLARTTMSMLHSLQHVNPDNSVFESWRFCFNCSLDILSNDNLDLATFLNDLLDQSSLSQNPLTTKNSELYSKIKDDSLLEWVLLVVEASASSLKSPETLHRVYDFCFAELVHKHGTDGRKAELLHSVLLSLHTTHPQVFSDKVSEYIKFVLAKEGEMNERQWLVIFTTMYRLSTSSQTLDEEEDPRGILTQIKRTLGQAQDAAARSKLIKTLIEILPIIPAPFLARNIRDVDNLLKQAEDRSVLEAKFIETCTTTMSSEKAQICSRYLLRRNPGVEERARL